MFGVGLRRQLRSRGLEPDGHRNIDRPLLLTACSSLPARFAVLAHLSSLLAEIFARICADMNNLAILLRVRFTIERLADRTEILFKVFLFLIRVKKADTFNRACEVVPGNGRRRFIQTCLGIARGKVSVASECGRKEAEKNDRLHR